MELLCCVVESWVHKLLDVCQSCRLNLWEMIKSWGFGVSKHTIVTYLRFCSMTWDNQKDSLPDVGVEDGNVEFQVVSNQHLKRSECTAASHLLAYSYRQLICCCFWMCSTRGVVVVTQIWEFFACLIHISLRQLDQCQEVTTSFIYKRPFTRIKSKMM